MIFKGKFYCQYLASFPTRFSFLIKNLTYRTHYLNDHYFLLNPALHFLLIAFHTMKL